MRIVYLQAARDDLDAVFDHVALEDCDAADRLIAMIRHAVSALKDYPRRAPEWAPGIRKLSVGTYAIMYRIADDIVSRSAGSCTSGAI